MRAWVLLLALAGCEDSSRARDRRDTPRLEPKNDRAPVADVPDRSSVEVSR